MRLLSFLRSVFRRRRVPPANPPHVFTEDAPTPAPAPEEPAPEVAPPPPVAVDVIAAADEPLADDEDEWRDHEEEEEDAGPDPFISGTDTAFALPGDVEALRQQARLLALSDEHRLPLSSPAGPGSLAEALNALIAEGRVEADFVDDPSLGSYMHYRPVARDL